jgi:hypothetical protein
MPRKPVYGKGMDAKQRYRRRLALQSALTRVPGVLARNAASGIPPDRTTGELAAQLVVWLVRFTVEAGVELPDLADGPDLSRFEARTKARQKETAARYRRRKARGLG